MRISKLMRKTNTSLERGRKALNSVEKTISCVDKEIINVKRI